MDLKMLQKHIRTLVTLEETDSPVISCYLTLDSEPASWRTAFDLRLQVLRRTLRGDVRWDFEEAVGRIEKYLRSELAPESKGVAIFARGGEKPFFLPLQFQVVLPTWLATWLVVNSTPNIYHLVELKDTYHRFVVMLFTTENARILEVNLGAVTEAIWRERPDLRKRVGREWTKEHYQSHRRERTDKFLKEVLAVLDGLMRAGGHTHLILAGNPWETARLRQALPKRLIAKLVDTIPASGNDQISDVVATTLSLFIDVEEQESQAMVEKLQYEIVSDGLAVVGEEQTLQALRMGQADVLIIAKTCSLANGWCCNDCTALTVGAMAPQRCLHCGATKFRPVELREELVRLAEQNGATVEVVQQDDRLMKLGGVGALLRYRLPQSPATESQPTELKVVAPML
jgi:rubrerythrin